MTAEQQAAVEAMADRISARAGFDPAIIIAILTALAPLLANCLKPKPPAPPTPAKDALMELATEHQFKCPWWVRPIIHSKLPAGHKSLADVEDTWAAITDDVLTNPDQVAAAFPA